MPAAVLLADQHALLGEAAAVTGERPASRAYADPVGSMRAEVLVRPGIRRVLQAALRGIPNPGKVTDVH